MAWQLFRMNCVDGGKVNSLGELDRDDLVDSPESLEVRLDLALELTFPASDPVAVTVIPLPSVELPWLPHPTR